MKTSLPIFFAAATCVLLCAGTLLLAPAPRTVTIVRTQDGFAPASVSIRTGDTVRFTIAPGVRSWPASDGHPTHGAYPEFDPRRTLTGGEVWSFTFTRPGVWGYHDHIAPPVKGVVLVEGEKGESIESCLAIVGDGNEHGYCFAGAVRAAIQEESLDEVFDMLRTLYTTVPAFKNQCHDVMHIVGAAAFSAYLDTNHEVLRPETRYCGYGFYHGFMEEMLATYGSGYLDEAGRYCASMEDAPLLTTAVAQTASRACFHGIGHALFDSLPETVWGDEETMASSSIALCKKLDARDEPQRACVSGVFNSLAIARSAETYALSPRLKDPTALCAIQHEAYQPACVMELSNAHIHWKGLDEEGALAYIAGLPQTASLWALEGYFDDSVRSTLASTTIAHLHTRIVALDSPERITAAIDGTMVALASGGTPGAEYLPMVELCALFTNRDHSNHCYRTLVGRLSLYDAPTRAAVCALLPPPRNTRCAAFISRWDLPPPHPPAE